MIIVLIIGLIIFFTVPFFIVPYLIFVLIIILINNFIKGSFSIAKNLGNDINKLVKENNEKDNIKNQNISPKQSVFGKKLQEYRKANKLDEE